MSIYTITFSPTGGTKRAADRLAAALGPCVQEIDLTVPGTDYSQFSFCAGDICVVAVPSYGGLPPRRHGGKWGKGSFDGSLRQPRL